MNLYYCVIFITSFNSLIKEWYQKLYIYFVGCYCICVFYL